MANIREVQIEGALPFDWSSHLLSDEAHMMASWFLCPSIGIKLEFSPNPAYHRPNDHGGETAMYTFSVTGQEAIHLDAVRTLRRIFAKLGLVHMCIARDIENNTEWEEVL
jgi:hypothetical protein